MDGGAWPFLVGGVICLVNSDNERDSPLLTSRLDLDSRVMRPGGVFPRLCVDGERVGGASVPWRVFSLPHAWEPSVSAHSKSAADAVSLLRGIHGSEAVRD